MLAATSTPATSFTTHGVLGRCRVGDVPFRSLYGERSGDWYGYVTCNDASRVVLACSSGATVVCAGVWCCRGRAQRRI